MKKRTGTLQQLSDEYLESLTHRHIVASNPMLGINPSTIQGCICPCIKEDTIVECACPICTGFECALKGLQIGMARARRHSQCEGCMEWAMALRDPHEFSAAIMCHKQELEGYELKSGKKLILRQLSCCLNARLGSTSPCSSCGIDKFLPTCSCLSRESLSMVVTWLKQQPTLEGKNHDIVKDRFRDYTGTLGEVLEVVIRTHKDYEYHRWRDFFLRHQFHLDCEHFDGEIELIVLADFASAMKLGAGVKVTCESDST